MKEKVQGIAICGIRGHAEKFGNMINSYPESRTIAVWDTEPALAQEVAERLHCTAINDYDRLLRSPDLDAVVVTAANVLHPELIEKAAAAGKSIFVEKPLCITAADAHTIRDTIQQSGVKFYMTDPFVNASTVEVRNLIQSGKIGRVLSARVRFCSNQVLYKQRTKEEERRKVLVTGGGMMSDTGGHALHILSYLFGKPQDVYARFAYADEDMHSIGNEEYIAVLCGYPNEMTATIECGLIAAGYTNCLEINGTRGSVLELGVGTKRAAVQYCVDIDEGGAKNQWQTVPEEQFPPDPDDHIRYFVRMLAYDLPNEQVGIDPLSVHGLNIDDAVALVEMREAIYASAESGCRIPLP